MGDLSAIEGRSRPRRDLRRFVSTDHPFLAADGDVAGAAGREQLWPKESASGESLMLLEVLDASLPVDELSWTKPPRASYSLHNHSLLYRSRGVASTYRFRRRSGFRRSDWLCACLHETKNLQLRQNLLHSFVLYVSG